MLTLVSKKNKIYSSFKTEYVVFHNNYHGQKILLIALYEKNFLRNDIKNFLILARSKGVYVMGVNTKKLLHDASLQTYFDCYIERYNFGRDFGSYKLGFQYLFRHQYHVDCPRLLMLNDSVFYEPTRSEKFIEDLLNTSVEVLGATENFDISHHLGSFCISIGGTILRHKKFRQYWKAYSLTDIRPKVIKKGEVAFSTCLKSLVSTSNQFRALYDTTRLIQALAADEHFLNTTLTMARKDSLIQARPQLEFFLQRFYMGDCSKIKNLLGHFPIFDFTSMEAALRDAPGNNAHPVLFSLRRFVEANVIRSFRQGSQIHWNTCLLVYLGLPLIKLDVFFRGALSEEDLLILFGIIEAQTAQELRLLLFRNGCAPEGLSKFTSSLFHHGYI